MSNDARKLQGVIDIVGHYGKRYRLTFGADKTKVTVTGSKIDMQYNADTGFWSLYGEPLTVAEDNDHLGLIVSGINEEIKNVDSNIASARGALFSLLENTFSYKCKLSPAVLLHSWRIFISPVLRSGLSALPIRPSALKPMEIFHKKTLRGALKLSQRSPSVSLYFLLGELPIEAVLHLDLMSLFWSTPVWTIP